MCVRLPLCADVCVCTCVWVSVCVIICLYTYFGGKLSKDGDCSEEINIRISKANYVLKTIWKSTVISIHKKVIFFKATSLASCCMTQNAGGPQTPSRRSWELSKQMPKTHPQDLLAKYNLKLRATKSQSGTTPIEQVIQVSRKQQTSKKSQEQL